MIGRGETKRRTTQNRRRGEHYPGFSFSFLLTTYIIILGRRCSSFQWESSFSYFLIPLFACQRGGGGEKGASFLLLKEDKKEQQHEEQQCSFFSLSSPIAPGANISSVQMTMLRQLLPHPPQSGSHRCNQRCLPPLYVRKYSSSGRKHCVRNNTTPPPPFPTQQSSPGVIIISNIDNEIREMYSTPLPRCTLRRRRESDPTGQKRHYIPQAIPKNGVLISPKEISVV